MLRSIKKLQPNKIQICSIVSAATILIGMAIAGISPLLQGKASATSNPPTNVNLTARTKILPGPSGTGSLTLEGCSGAFTNPPVTIQTGFLDSEWVNGVAALTTAKSEAELIALIQRQPGSQIRTFLGTYKANNKAQMDIAWTLVSSIGNSMAVIQFKHGDPGNPTLNGAFQTGSNSICDSIHMIRVSATEWQGYQAENVSGSIDYWMDYKINDTSGPNSSGTLCFADFFPGSTVDVNGATGEGATCKTFVVAGTPDNSTGPGSTTIGAIQGAWVDAAHIQLTDTAHNGEVYQKFKWSDDTSNNGTATTHNAVYFLTTAQGDRAGLVWSTGNACDNPIAQIGKDGRPTGNCTNANGGAGNCVPFIVVRQPINLNGSTTNINVGGFQNEVDSLGNADAVLNDYNTSCNWIGMSPPAKLSAQVNSIIWFYYSQTNDAATVVFTDGAANEKQYIGTPVYAKFGTNAYQGGAKVCNGQLFITPPADPAHNPTNIMAGKWTLTDGNCQSVKSFGDAHVAVLGGPQGETGFTDTTGTLNNTGTGSVAPKIGCDALTGNPLNWITCPVIDLMTSTVKTLDASITELLNINTDDFFTDTNSTGLAYHRAWAVFRTFALAVIVIAGLVMVIAQAAGLELLSAYAIRKLLPALIIAVIGITLSWPLIKEATVATNDISNGLRTVLYMPFKSLSGQNVNLNNLSTSIGALFVVGGVLAYGIFGLLSLAITALLAVLIAFAILVLRLILFAFLLMASPVAIACSILPGTRRLWKIWLESLGGILLLSLAWSAIVAVGDDFSVTALVGSQNAQGGTQTLWQFVAIAVYYGKYFVFFVLVRAMSGLLATIGGFVNDRSRGAFDRLRNFRRQTAAKRGEKWRSGSLFRDNALSRPLNALGKRVGAAQAGAGIHAFSPLARGRQARALYDAQLAEQTLKNNPLLHELQNNDDANNVLGLSGGSLAGLQQAARDLFTDEAGNYDADRANTAMAAARAVGVNRAHAMAALKTSMQNKARAFSAGNVRALDRGVRRLARNNEEYHELAHQAAFFARANGRADLGGTQWISWGRNNGAYARAEGARTAAAGGGANAAQAEMAYWQSMSDSNMEDGVGRTGVQAIESAHDTTLIQLGRTYSRILREAPEGSQARIEAAKVLKEIQGGRTGAGGSGYNQFNDMLFGAGPGQLGLDPNLPVAPQLANLVGDDPATGLPAITADGLTNLGRTWGEMDTSRFAAAGAGAP